MAESSSESNLSISRSNISADIVQPRKTTEKKDETPQLNLIELTTNQSIIDRKSTKIKRNKKDFGQS